MVKTLIVAAALVGVAPLGAAAQAQVEESTPLVRPGEKNEAGASGDIRTITTELYYQLQALQQEVQELRGMVEQQTHEIKRLEKQRMDDYLDLDRRLGMLKDAGASHGSSNPARSLDGAGSGEGTQSGGARSETDVYRDAYQLLRDRKIDAAIEAFNGYLDQYPQGDYAGNSYYWLGEIYLLQEDLEQAQKWFAKLLEDFPDDRKVSDTKFKLGTVHHRMGNDDKARALLEDVSGDGSDASRLASRYLEENFE